MHKVFAMFFLGMAQIAFLPSCAEKASDNEIAQMCERLTVLRNKVGDEAMKSACITEAMAEGVSKRQALCRIAAVNTQEYWNRCRTGGAPPQR